MLYAYSKILQRERSDSRNALQGQSSLVVVMLFHIAHMTSYCYSAVTVSFCTYSQISPLVYELGGYMTANDLEQSLSSNSAVEIIAAHE